MANKVSLFFMNKTRYEINMIDEASKNDIKILAGKTFKSKNNLMHEVSAVNVSIIKKENIKFF